jgi:hypothetical protein
MFKLDESSKWGEIKAKNLAEQLHSIAKF